MKVTKKKKEVYRLHDRIRILTPEVFIRCGYPLTTEMISESMTEEQLKAIHEMFEKFGIRTDPSKVPATNKYFTEIQSINDKPFQFVRNVIARELLGQKRWGGPERKIYTELRSEFLNATATVYSKRVVKTGTYMPGWGHTSYFGEYDYEPAYLDGEETHIILTICTDYGSTYPSQQFEIDERNVVKIDKSMRDPDFFIIGKNDE